MYYLVVRLKLLICAVSIKSHDYGLPHVKHHLSLLNAVLNFTHHAHELFDITLPPIRGVHPSLTLKATVLHPCDNQDSALLDSIVECQITRDTDAGHA